AASVGEHVRLGELIQRGEDAGTAEWVGAPGVRALAVVQSRAQARPADCRGDWHAVAEPLAEHDEVGLQHVGLEGEEIAGATAIGKLMKRTRGSRSWSVSQPVTAPASPFLPWKPNRVARMTSRAWSRARAAQSAFWIASEPDAAHITCSRRRPPVRSRSTATRRR